jgi:hypothetical protein
LLSVGIGGGFVVFEGFFDFLGAGGAAFEGGEHSSGREAGAAQATVGFGEFARVFDRLAGPERGHAALNVGVDQSGFLFAFENLGHGLLRCAGGDAAGAQIAEHAHAAEAVVFGAKRGEAFGEFAVVEVTDVFEARDDGVDIGEFRGAAAEPGLSSSLEQERCAR